MEKITSIVCFVLMCVGLGLLMILGGYNHPTGDDYYYAAATKQVLLETGSIGKTLGAALQGVADVYVNWQGTYSAMFLMHLPPNLFQEDLYKLVTTMILLSYTGGVFYLLKPFCCRVLKESKAFWCLVSSVFVLLTIQTVPFHGESFFWYNGSMYYTGYLAVTFFFGGIMCRYVLEEQTKVGRFVAMAFLTVFLAGGNYVSLLPAILITFTVAAGLLWKHKNTGKGIRILVIALLMTAGLIVSAIAPGNQVREGGLWEMSAPKAVFKSLFQGLLYLRGWLGVWWLLAVVVLTPFFWYSYKRISARFSYPVLVLGYLYGIFCSMSCPTFYAMNSTGPARSLAIVYYGFMLFTLVGYYYLLGYIHRVWVERAKNRSVGNADAKSAEKISEKICEKKTVVSYFWPAYVGIILLLVVIQIATGQADGLNSVTAAKLLVSGEAAAYEQEYLARLEVLQDETVKDVVFTPYKNQPTMLFVGDFTDDVENENNVMIAEYFGKNSIMVDYGDK